MFNCVCSTVYVQLVCSTVYVQLVCSTVYVQLVCSTVYVQLCMFDLINRTLAAVVLVRAITTNF